MFKNILLATDGSVHAKRAAATAADLAATYGARLTIMTVVSRAMSLEDIESAPQARQLPRSAKQQMKQIHQMINESRSADADIYPYVPALPSLTHDLGEIILDEAEAQASRRKVTKVTRVLDHGDAASQILKQATKSKADLIVIGTRGLSNLSGFLIGSVSNRVIHNAKCPCLTVK